MNSPTIVIAEPDAAIAASIARQFRATGWQVAIAQTADEVVQRCLESPPDVVLVDTAVGAVDLLKRLREHRQARGVRVALMGLEVTNEVRARLVAEGAFVFLGMPLRLQSIEALKKVVQAKEQAPRVLISDDDDLVIRSLTRAARHEGLEPVAETDAGHVVEMAKEVHPQCIVLDINQKNLDGRDVLARLKQDPATRDIRVVMLTGVEDQLTRHDCLILGADDYVVKPIDPLFMVRIARKIAEAGLSS